MSKYEEKNRRAWLPASTANGVSAMRPGRRRDTQRNAVDIDGLGQLEGADHKRHEVGRHAHRLGEHDAPRPPGARCGDSGPLERAVRCSTTSVTAKVALRSGSSQHGNARRASAGSNWVVAMVCVSPSSSVKVLR